MSGQRQHTTSHSNSGQERSSTRRSYTSSTRRSASSYGAPSRSTSSRDTSARNASSRKNSTRSASTREATSHSSSRTASSRETSFRGNRQEAAAYQRHHAEGHAYDYQKERTSSQRKRSSSHASSSRARRQTPDPLTPSLQTLSGSRSRHNQGGFLPVLFNALANVALPFKAAALAVLVIFVLFIFPGPFAQNSSNDEEITHVGVMTAQALSNTGATLASNCSDQLNRILPVEDELEALTAYSPTKEDLLKLANNTSPFIFNLNTAEASLEENTTPTLSDESNEALTEALSYYTENDISVGFILLDLESGRGIASNLDAEIYGASSFKGPFCAYVVEDAFPANINQASSTNTNYIENTIIWSDNSSYGKLRRTYGNDDFESWLSEAGVNTSLATDTYYPTYTPRQSALMWLKIYQYLSTSDSTAAQWFSDLLSNTEVSFIRNGIEGTSSAGETDYEESDENASSTSSESSDDSNSTASSSSTSSSKIKLVGDITVRNKAGWINGNEDDAICDAGIVTINDHDYLLSIMTAAPDSSKGEEAFALLARTILESRVDLAS